MAGYIGNGPGVGRASRFLFLAEEAQTSFVGMDALGMTLRYTPGFVEVAVNGMWLPPNEYTAADGSTITFGTGLTAGDKVYVYVLSTFSAADTISPTHADFSWYARAIGEVFMINEALVGAAIPPANHSVLSFIKLTKDLTGSGQYNEGKLSTQSVTGSSPLILATAVISLSDSPMNGETIHLLNTEERILRPRESANALQNDQAQQIVGSLGTAGSNGMYGSTIAGSSGALKTTKIGDITASGGTGGSYNFIEFDSATSPNARVGAENRMKNIGVSAYMRVK